MDWSGKAPMTYSDFTLADVRRTFHLTTRDHALFPVIGSLEPSAWLQYALDKGKDLAVWSEKARSEFIVAPILMTCREFLEEKIHVYSGVWLDAAADQGLKGECDFILARTASAYDLQGPLMVVLEAKKHDLDVGLGQCAAQMVGARVFNEKDGNPVPMIYGCVTNGSEWQFLKLQGQDLILQPLRTRTDDIGQILWLIVECVKDVLKHVLTEAAA
jgi:hypothetical protein